MAQKHDFQKEWEKVKKQLLDFSQEAKVLAKRGEKELVKISRQGKLHFDSTAATLKKEQLFYKIGKEYVSSQCPSQPNSRLSGLLKELDKVNSEISRVKKKLSSAPGSKKTAKRASRKKA